jgi:hypothetical protein
MHRDRLRMSYMPGWGRWDPATAASRESASAQPRIRGADPGLRKISRVRCNAGARLT